MTDLILLLGDYLQIGDPERWRAQAAELRTALLDAGISAPLGVYAIRGNVDPSGWERIFEGLPVTAVSSTTTIRLEELELIALGPGDSFDTSLALPSSDRYSVVMGHAPDYALGDVGADLLLAGHTHGGQVRLPLLGPVVTLSEVPRDWAAGVTELDRGRTLVVSRGIGMERAGAPELRFLCRPELVVIELVPEPGLPVVPKLSARASAMRRRAVTATTSSGWRASGRPSAARRSCWMTGMRPSPAGPRLSRRFPPRLTLSTKSCTSASRSR